MPKKKTPSSDELSLRIDPVDGFSTGSSAQIAPSLEIRGAEITDLATLAIWINGREVTTRLDPDVVVRDGEKDGIRVELPTLGFGGGLHHLRASLSNADGTAAAIDDRFYEVGNDGPAMSVIDPRGDLLVPSELDLHAYPCCKKESGGHGGGRMPGGQTPGGRPQGGVPPVQPPDDGGGAQPPGQPMPGDPAKPDPECKITGLKRVVPGPVVPENVDATIEVKTDPEDAELEFSRDIAVTYIQATQFLIGGRDLQEVTRRQLSRKGVSVLQEVRLPRDGFVNLVDPRTVTVLVSQINDFFRASGSLRTLTFQAAGVPTRVRLGVRCKGGGRKGNLTLLIRDA